MKPLILFRVRSCIIEGQPLYNHQLDTFVKVAERGSFSKAASELYISPTAVIKQMNLLETSLGVTLFNRTHRGLTLTRAGESLLRDAHHIIQYCGETADRARMADAAGKSVIRVGLSPMTPSSFLTGLWPRVQKRCPGASIKLVSFENTPENARHILSHLGEDIDIVAGAFDDAFLQSRHCAGLVLEHMPLRVAVPSNHPLAARTMLEPKDLEGQEVLIIQRGWNEATDRLQDFLVNEVADVAVEEFPFICLDVFNRCEEEGKLLISVDAWESAHPLLSSKAVAWDFELPFGILHALEPSEQVRMVLDAIAE